MRQFNLEIDKTSPKTSRFVVPANEHFSILVRYKNWEDKQEWLDYTLVDDAGTEVVKYKKEAENDSVLYFCGIMDTSTNLRFKTSTLASTLAPRDTMQVVALASSSQDNCYICSADYARTTGEGGGGVSEEYVDSKVQEEATARTAADEALRADIPTKTSELTNDSGYLTEDTTTLSVAFGGVAKKITPKDVISFSSLTWQGQKHELGSKDFGVFDGNFQLDEAFWPAKPLPGYLYIECCNLANYDTPTLKLMNSSDDSVLTSFIVSNSMAIKLPSDGFNVARFSYERLDEYDFSFVTYNHAQKTINIIDDGAIIINPANNSLQSYTLIIKQKLKEPPPNNKLIVVADSSQNTVNAGLNIQGTNHNIEVGHGVGVQTYSLTNVNYFYINQTGWHVMYFDNPEVLNKKEITSNEYFYLYDYAQYGDIVLTNVDSNFS